MSRKTTIILVGVVIMALALVGIGYGLWFEDLLIKGRVTTGVLDVGFSDYGEDGIFEWFTDAEGKVLATELGGVPDLEIPEIAPGLFVLKDNVYCDIDFYGPDFRDNPEPGVDTGWDLAWIKVEGAYPSYHCLVKFDIHNRGTVPVHLSDWYVKRVNEMGAEIAPDAMHAFWVAEPFCKKAANDAGVLTDDAIGPDGHRVIQLHPREHADCWVLLHFTNEDNVQELTTYYFAFWIRAAQWNEAMPF